MIIRDGPLEKLSGGGRGVFEPQEFIFRYQIPCMNLFLGHSMDIF